MAQISWLQETSVESSLLVSFIYAGVQVKFVGESRAPASFYCEPEALFTLALTKLVQLLQSIPNQLGSPLLIWEKKQSPVVAHDPKKQGSTTLIEREENSLHTFGKHDNHTHLYSIVCEPDFLVGRFRLSNSSCLSSLIPELRLLWLVSEGTGMPSALCEFAC